MIFFFHRGKILCSYKCSHLQTTKYILSTSIDVLVHTGMLTVLIESGISGSFRVFWNTFFSFISALALVHSFVKI